MNKEIKGIKLTGQVILDDKTMAQLKEDIRKEVVEDILTNGARWDEAEEYLSKRPFEDYLTLIDNTIDDVIQNIKPGDLSFSSDKRKYKILTTIKGLLELNL